MTMIPSNQAKTPLQEGSPDPLHTFARELCALPENQFGPEFLDEHLLIVERYALKLAELFDADREIVRTAAVLHDLAAIQDFTSLPNHAEKGAGEIASILSSCNPTDGFRFGDEHISRIAVCVSHADAMSQITRPFYWFHYARTLKCLKHCDAIEWYRSLVFRNWNSLADVARALIEMEYSAVTTIIRPV